MNSTILPAQIPHFLIQNSNSEMLSSRGAFKALIRSYISSSRWYYTTSNQKNQVSLYAKISPLGNPNVNITPVLEKWVEMGNKVRFAELQRIILDLRKRKRFAQALQMCNLLGL
ncbi:hypothetical protein CDL12_30094 [Handroanthus impetiginosus]|uniref:Uncharacterized protein n=1 Tax=Handroanthus impetiginosus TaxID=429701 RepID=A0A2G9FWJ4_9LAMI|nr:hypothetical protein CDL12_30094 [Handroanthus impetiginosus]